MLVLTPRSRGEVQAVVLVTWGRISSTYSRIFCGSSLYVPRNPRTMQRKKVSTASVPGGLEARGAFGATQHDVDLLPEPRGSLPAAEQRLLKNERFPPIGPRRIDDEQLVDPAGQGITGAEKGPAVAGVIGLKTQPRVGWKKLDESTPLLLEIERGILVHSVFEVQGSRRSPCKRDR